MLDLLMTALTGGATGIIGVILGKVFSIGESFIKEREKDKEHERVVELTRLQHELGAKEKELDHEIAMDGAAVNLRMASYEHDSRTGRASQWVIDGLRLVRPALTVGLIVLLGAIHFTSDQTQQLEIVASVIYMATSAVTWWFGDRMAQAKK